MEKANWNLMLEFKMWIRADELSSSKNYPYPLVTSAGNKINAKQN